MNNGNGSMDLAMNVSRKLATLRLEDASASKAADKKMIDNLVTGYAGGFSKINAFLIHSVREVLQATQVRFKDDLASLQTTLDAAETREFKNKPTFSDVVADVAPGNDFNRPRLGGWLRKAYTKTKMQNIFNNRKGSNSSLFSSPKENEASQAETRRRALALFRMKGSGSSLWSSPKDASSSSPKDREADVDLETGGVIPEEGTAAATVQAARGSDDEHISADVADEDKREVEEMPDVPMELPEEPEKEPSKAWKRATALALASKETPTCKDL